MRHVNFCFRKSQWHASPAVNGDFTLKDPARSSHQNACDSSKAAFWSPCPFTSLKIVSPPSNWRMQACVSRQIRAASLNKSVTCLSQQFRAVFLSTDEIRVRSTDQSRISLNRSEPHFSQQIRAASQKKIKIESSLQVRDVPHSQLSAVWVFSL